MAIRYLEGARLRAREALEVGGLAGLVATPGANFAHLTGLQLDRSERLICIGLSSAGEDWIVCPSFEATRLAGALPGVDLLAWEEDEDPFAMAGARVAAGAGLWALEPTTWVHDAERLRSAAPRAGWVDGATLFAELRRTKTAAEIAILRRAIQLSWAVYDEVVAALETGMTELDGGEAIRAACAHRGHESWSLVQFGPASAIPHGEPGERRLEDGSAVLIDWGVWADGYTSDLTRTFWWDAGVAPPDREPADFRAVRDLAREAQRAAIDSIAPGLTCGAADEAARSVIRDAGQGEHFLHRLGHGLGREVHESPYLTPGSADLLQAGDVVTVEPGIYLPGRFGVRWEDDVLITGDGCEVLSSRSESAPQIHS